MVEVLLREIPEAFRDPRFAVVRNNVYELIPNSDGVLKKHLVTQLQEATRVRLPAEQVARLMQGLPLGISTLATVGSFCSVATLGVAVVGFAALGYGLYRIGKRLETVQAGVDRIAQDTAALLDAVQLLDIKVDHLLLLSREQSAALRQISYQLHLRDFAEIAQAAEVLEVRSIEAPSERRDREIAQAADRLQVHRLRFAQWLADCPNEAGEVAVELAQATTLLGLAESRARLLLGDTAFAERVLETAATTMRQAASRATTYATARWSLTGVLECGVAGLDVPDLLARTVAWATRTPVEVVAAEHLRLAVAESARARGVARSALRDGVLTGPLVDSTPSDLLNIVVEARVPGGFFARLTGQDRVDRQVVPIGMLALELEGMRALREKLRESVAAFGDDSSPASMIAGFDAYAQCGQRLEASLLGVKIGAAMGWDDDRVKRLTEITHAAATLRPSFQVEFVQVAG